MKLMIASDLHGSAGYCRAMLEALKREVERQSMQRNQRYVSRAEKQILGFLVMVLAGLTGLALTVTGHMTGGFIAYAAAFLGLAIASHYE